VVKEQKERLSSKVVGIDASIKESRSRISAKATRFSVQHWQKAEAAYNQISHPLTFPSFSYGDYQNQIDRLTYVNKLYENCEASAQSTIKESISSSESGGKIWGGIMGGMVGSLVGGVISEVVACFVFFILLYIEDENTKRDTHWGSLFSGFWYLGLIVGLVLGAWAGSSRVGKQCRRERAEEIRRETGE
jgi:hypothetical protein